MKTTMRKMMMMGVMMSGGFTVLPENIAALREFVYEQVKNQAASLSAMPRMDLTG